MTTNEDAGGRAAPGALAKRTISGVAELASVIAYSLADVFIVPRPLVGGDQARASNSANCTCVAAISLPRPEWRSTPPPPPPPPTATTSVRRTKRCLVPGSRFEFKRSLSQSAHIFCSSFAEIDCAEIKLLALVPIVRGTCSSLTSVEEDVQGLQGEKAVPSQPENEDEWKKAIFRW